jgi:cytochrome c1
MSGPSGEGRCATFMVIVFLVAFIVLAAWVLLERPR